MNVLGRLRSWASSMKRDAVALSLAVSDRRTPWYAKAVAVLVVAYALSPIDLIPDFVPVLGMLDDLILLPLGIALVVKLMPEGLIAEFRQEADTRGRMPRSYAGAAVVVLLWLLSALLVWRLAVSSFGGEG
jgi:uncharacterized membrane protein YkvA (DUF1232 family)